MSTEPVVQTAAEVSAEETKESNTLKVIGWLTVGLAVAAVGFFVGRELLCRYKFNHRNPYDFYAHAGEKQTGEFGLGV
ncbi:MAG TPA: hypothetical protein VKF63_01390 [Terracidiphilus sp.]|jgi:hypothetical protein|nr:hypothetical protein [Terracidiphilus sp.]